jgi:hypothetical protein
MNLRVQVVLDLDGLSFLLILSFELLSIFDHFLDLSLGQTSTGLNNHGLIFTSSRVFSRDLHDTISIDIKSDLNLRDSSGSRWDSDQLELS